MNPQKFFAVLVFLACLSLAGCAPASPTQDSPLSLPPPVSLDGTGWLLETLPGQVLIPGRQVTLNFAQDSFSGNDGCNQYSGSYTLDGNKLTVGENIATTLMGCEQAVIEQASAYLAVLTQASNYQVSGAQLMLLDAQGETLATFRERSEPGSLDPQNATYTIDGKAIILVNGMAETAVAPGSAAKQVTRYFGNPVQLDLNGDGAIDAAFVLVQSSGGSGTFYYVAAALNTPDGSLGTNAIFIGDRIAPQSTLLDPNNPAQFIVNYADRAADEPMSAQPSQAVSKRFKLEGSALVEVPAPNSVP